MSTFVSTLNLFCTFENTVVFFAAFKIKQWRITVVFRRKEPSTVAR